MKKKISIIILLLILGISINSYANFMIFNAKAQNIEIQNIPEDITEIYLVTYTDMNCDIREAYKGYDMNFSNMKIYDDLPQWAYSKDETITPFTEDNYTVNLNYNKKDYYVEVSPSYTYTVGNSSYSNGSVNYYKTYEEFIKDSNFEDNIDKKQIICKRHITYSAYKLAEVKKIDLSSINNSTLNYQITDFSPVRELNDPNGGFALRFRNTNNEYNTIKFGNGSIYQDSRNKRKPDDSELIIDVKVNYITGEKKGSNRLKSNSQYLANMNSTNKFIADSIIAIIVTEISEIIVSFFFKIKEKRIIIIANLVTQIALHVLTFIISSCNIFMNTLGALMILFIEISIVIIEYKVYLKKLPHYTNKRLLLYSIIANLLSFSLSIVAELYSILLI